MEAAKALGPEQIAQLKAVIAQAERQTSGEIRVFIEDRSEDGPLDRAAFLFGELGMHKTTLRNGVLIYLAYHDRKFAIIGDYGIHEKVGDDFWDAIKLKMTGHFKEGRITQGLSEAVSDAGKVLSEYFPFVTGDRNELSDDIIFGNKKK